MDRHSDVFVIGGGIIGLASAYYLAQEGKGVRLVEQDSIGAGASYGNCGLIFTSHLIPLCVPGAIRQEIKRMFRRTSPLYVSLAPDIKRFMWFLNFAGKCNPGHMAHAIRAREKILQNSKSLFETLFREEQLECDWEEKGVLLVFKTQTEMQKYVQTNDRLKPFGFDAVPLVGAELLSLEPALRKVVATPWESGFRLGGTMEFSGVNSNIRAGRIQNLKSVAGEYLKEPIGGPVIEEWVGMRPMVYDDLPIIGRPPNQRNLVIATGHGMSGISMATSTGKLVSEIIAGCEPHMDPTAFGVDRFNT